MRELIAISLFLCVSFSNAQMQISDWVQENKISSGVAPSLYYVDFWATYCGPCEYVSKQLNVLQKQYPEDLYVLSLTKENRDVVSKFLKRKPTGLAVAIDYQGEAFEKYQVAFMPYGVLFDGKGKLLWKGKAADLDENMIKKYLRRSGKHYTINEFFPVVKEFFDDTFEDDIEDNFKIQKLEETSDIKFTKIYSQNYLHISGNLKALIAYLLHVSESQIHINDKDNAVYELKYKEGVKPEKLLRKLKKVAGLKINDRFESTDVYSMNFESDHSFWDKHQFEWGEDTPNILISDADFMADNITLTEAARILSNLLNKPIVVEATDFDEKALHDWQIHYLYKNFMVEGLTDNYQISIQENNVLIEQYYVTKKTP